VSDPAEREAVQALWQESARRLKGWFERRTGSAHDAEDLVQETFLRVQSRLSTLSDGERLAAWAGRIAANVLADHARARGHRPVALVEDAQGAEALVGGEADCGQTVAGWLEAFLLELDPADAALLRAVDLEGRAQADVGRELGLSESGARSRVQRARARLRERLEACCRFAFDARGNLTDATRRHGHTCGCDPA